jgi:hypothetical protein
MNDIEKYFFNNSSRYITKWQHYFDIYDRHFAAFRGKEIVVLEIGVFQGGSLQMWKSYFGPRARIFGLDINPECAKLEEPNVQVFIGSQEDPNFLRDLKLKIPPIDILIDDGGHSMKQQITTFKVLFDHLKPHGIYLCEDTHTSYWVEYGGGYKRSRTFIEYCKNLIDELHGFHSEQNSFKPTALTGSLNSITFYDSIVVMEKKTREKPHQVFSGSQSFDPILGIKSWKYRALLKINILLQKFRIASWRW